LPPRAVLKSVANWSVDGTGGSKGALDIDDHLLVREVQTAK
jgi:hypothetical protein